MSGSAPLTACQALMNADQAYADIMGGLSVRAITDQNGERIEYTSANSAALLAYIRRLQPQCPTYTALALGGCGGAPRPLRFLF